MALLCLGCRLTSRLRARRDSLLLEERRGKNSSSGLIAKVRLLTTLIPVTEILRSWLDYHYIGMIGSTLLSGPAKIEDHVINPVLVVALEKFFFEWVPSTAIIVCFK